MINVQSLSYTYPTGVSALTNVSLSINAGETVGIIGPNGAGKSTLVNHLNGVLLPSSGSVAIDGIAVEKKSFENIRKKVGVVFQNPDDMLFMPRVIDDVLFGPLNLGMDEHAAHHAAEDALHDLGLGDLADRPPFTLSQGQKRFAAIAAILVMKPSMLVLDEPTSDLDPRNRKKLISLLNSMAMTRIIVSHDLDFVWDTCSRVILISHGTIAADGQCHTILQDKVLLESNDLELPLRLQQ
ncbi:MAG: cobalt ABC transporter ATP-binding protein [Candidatus Raymondbacteria bacterium RifOxyA12_full_50_37]|uniref:Cobalt ABC transporter ATP-binding protein n=1 Tax=Candidatus Raymondbacteria bacterium RIFOXYD12_FULL_49_13 TaxID=1817890 RepID=A0A1F7F2B4_UNCRA|nr:MAG: cobalt ABC transporter ATP-binding protein [Candidatus Raymondbacteria bacterium RifOxyA12_full_50_37]OGJ88631.1 MAG: cobalt ABC transporter ATP-binding protein [Candidatus Raymondbacteria bacterium RIFOXYA2_FULL_49_16]OGJ90517.1 MAG: cobalt ABC transporter ATP-binding protein [Candidatus Raymondbacteria bacterium RifOxyB12_full_50_8]OGK00804.1 MAG: cobalt ABC transporter ATP-binding protein [Candidatus Raymondbacteria bacterium RIFOXYD12_FULL_49_13]OGK02893.1 MAG: cobalt ABC transporte